MLSLGSMGQNVVPVTLGSPTFHRRDVSAMRVTEALFPPLAELPLHAHERAILAVILEGSWDEQIEGHSHECLPGSVLVEPAQIKHTNRFHAGGARVLVIEADVAGSDLFDPCSALLRDAGCFNDWGVTALARRVAAEVGNPDNLSRLALESLTLELLVHAARRKRDRHGKGVPSWFHRVRERLHGEFARPPRLTELAETAGVHPMHVARVFRHGTGMSVGSYVRRLRLDWSAEQLSNGTTPLAEIAYRAGFADQSHFTRAFRRYAGLTPRRYREGRGRRKVCPVPKPGPVQDG